MTKDQWPFIKNFKESENWGNPALMNFELLRELDALRDYIQSPITVTCGTQGVHVVDSQHPLGLAVDIVIPDRHGMVLDMFFAISRFGFRGIGYYPEWQSAGKVCGGWHLDMRGSLGDRRELWMGVLEKGTQVYVKLSEFNLRQYAMVA